MDDTIIIKMQANGIILNMNETCDFHEIVKELEAKLKKNAKFFGNATVTVSFCQRKLNQLEEEKLLSVIKQNSQLQIACILDRNENNNVENVRYIQQDIPHVDTEPYCRYYAKDLKPGQILESEGNIVIVGDVVEGSTVVAVGNVIVLGSIFGEVYAGVDNTNRSFVVAMELQPEKLEINKIKYRPDRKNKKLKKQKDKLLLAYDKNIQVLAEPFTNELLQSLI